MPLCETIADREVKLAYDTTLVVHKTDSFFPF